MRVAVEFIAYLGVRLLLWVGARTPLSVLKRVLMPLASVGMMASVSRRAATRANLRMAFPEWSDNDIDRCTAEAGRYWGRLAAELTHSDELADASAARRVEPSLASLKDVTTGGTGVLILTAHLGNFELMARLATPHVSRFAVLHRGFRNRFFERFYRRRREAVGVDVLQRGSGMRDALRILKAGGAVAVALDQNQRPGRGIFVDMFGSPACTSTVLARLSLASGVPVLPMFAVWRGEYMELVVRPLIRPTGAGSPAAGLATRDDKVKALTARYTREIEEVVREYPEQWNWAHRRWKTRPEQAPEVDRPRRAASA